MIARKHINVRVVRPNKPLTLGDFSKVLFITKEEDKPFKKYATLEEVEKDFGKNSKMYKGITTFLSQEDTDGNVIKPSVWYCASKSTPNQEFLDSLPTGDFYGVVVDFFDEEFTKELAKWLTRNRKFAIVINTLAENNKQELKESPRIYYLAGKEEGENLDAFGLTAYTFVQGVNGRWADRRILGVEPSAKNTTQESNFNEGNINYTLSLVGYNAVTSGSWCSDGIRHADQTIKIDFITNTIETNLAKLKIESKNLTMDTEGLPVVEALLNRVMVACGKEGVIAKNNNKDYMYTVYVPSIEDTSLDTGLTVDDYINRTLRNVKVDFTITTEIEEIDVTLVWHDEPLKK